ncbi:MAG TPA: hypothetical protein VG871_01560 [Vicinamibacterales bacterium]|nr:hypothetical protein [Vicinamibacterales bacterium]
MNSVNGSTRPTAGGVTHVGRWICLVLLASMPSACSPRAAASTTRGARVVATDLNSDQETVAVIHSDIAGAAEMRFGNTRGELSHAAWEPYTNDRLWYLPGYNYRTQQIVYAEYRGSSLPSTGLALPVYAAAPGTPDGGTFPPIAVPDRRASSDIIDHRFDTWSERWASYQDAYGHGNVFYPLTHQRTGGADGGGFAWTDDSRWLVDAPETPDSILFALNYWRWLFPAEWRAKTGAGDVVNLEGATLEVALRGRGLDLGTAHVTFWLLCGGARWHLSQPLTAGVEQWATNRVALPDGAAAWQRSWSRGGEAVPFCLDKVESYGFAFRGFQLDHLPRGVIDIDDFRLTRDRS